MTSIGPALLLIGLALLMGSQLAIALHAFTGNPLSGLLCFFVPLYVYVYARKNKVGVWLMRSWYAGVALFVVGGVLST
ncbi:hypothetical protein [Polaromonas sp.]|uniref:hypothetical protein n=1 Tax=Polaromonas sp. TaxID=1869339 RepID=UPI003263345F